MRPLNRKTNNLWKKLLVVGASLVSASMLGCSHAKLKSDNEIWLLDAEEPALYRKIVGGKEEVIPIKKENKKTLEAFLCIHEKEVSEVIEAVVEGAK